MDKVSLGSITDRGSEPPRYPGWRPRVSRLANRGGLWGRGSARVGAGRRGSWWILAGFSGSRPPPAARRLALGCMHRVPVESSRVESSRGFWGGGRERRFLLCVWFYVSACLCVCVSAGRDGVAADRGEPPPAGARGTGQAGAASRAGAGAGERAIYGGGGRGRGRRLGL